MRIRVSHNQLVVERENKRETTTAVVIWASYSRRVFFFSMKLNSKVRSLWSNMSIIKIEE